MNTLCKAMLCPVSADTVIRIGGQGCRKGRDDIRVTLASLCAEYWLFDLLPVLQGFSHSGIYLSGKGERADHERIHTA